MARVTQEYLEGKVRIINKYLGFENPQYLTVGSIRLGMAYNGYGVERVMNDGGGIQKLTNGYDTAAKCAEFLSGMIAAFRIAQEENDS